MSDDVLKKWKQDCVGIQEIITTLLNCGNDEAEEEVSKILSAAVLILNDNMHAILKEHEDITAETLNNIKNKALRDAIVSKRGN